VRTSGNWVKGRFTLGQPQQLRYFGPVQPATEEELTQIAEGDRSQGIMKFLCAAPKEIFITQEKALDGSAGILISDQIIYAGKLFKVIKVKPWDMNGYLRAFGMYMGRVKKRAGNNQNGQ
jgi:hypothetical protein